MTQTYEDGDKVTYSYDNNGALAITHRTVPCVMQCTNRDNIYELYGPAAYIGASGGPSWYVGADMISLADPNEHMFSLDGFQITAGVGLGIDIHVVQTNTKPLRNKQEKLYNILTFKEKRL